MLVNDTFSDIVSKTDIKPGYRSDHSIVILEILINEFTRGKGTYKFNTSLLTNKDYIELVHNVIQDEKLKYAPLVYNLDFLNNPVQVIEPTIGYNNFLEMLLLRIRGETLRFSSILKKKEYKERT